MTPTRAVELLETHILDLEARITRAGEAFQELYSMTLDFAGDDVAPFFTEAYLYKKFGKEQARTILAMLHHVEEPFDLYGGRPMAGRWREYQEREARMKRFEEREG